jgi:hypothetical protein
MILEKDTIMGTFTHRMTYLPTLEASARKLMPHIPFTAVVKNNPINKNMALLREKFIESGKRYWIFLDDDIQFLTSEIVRNGLSVMAANKAGLVTPYMTYSEGALERPYNTEGLTTRKILWSAGYFMLVDSHKVGHIKPDLNLPCPNTAVDVSYSMEVRKAGYDILVFPDYVYHKQKYVPFDVKASQKTEKYLVEKWGNFYVDLTDKNNQIVIER